MPRGNPEVASLVCRRDWHHTAQCTWDIVAWSARSLRSASSLEKLHLASLSLEPPSDWFWNLALLISVELIVEAWLFLVVVEV